MKKKTRKRLLKEAALARKEAAGDFSHLKDKKGNLRAKPLAQPTLPQIALDEDDYKYGSGSDVSLRKDAAYFRGPTPIGSFNNAPASHAYPPGSNAWNPGYQESGPRPPYQYAGSEVGGYAASVHSTDKLVYPTESPYEHPGHYMQPAPSYRSQVSLHEPDRRPWEETPAPPLPSDFYRQQQHYNDEKAAAHDAGTEVDVEQYQPIDREALYARATGATGQPQHAAHPQRPDSRLDPRESYIDFAAAYADESVGHDDPFHPQAGHGHYPHGR